MNYAMNLNFNRITGHAAPICSTYTLCTGHCIYTRGGGGEECPHLSLDLLANLKHHAITQTSIWTVEVHLTLAVK